MKLVKNWPKRAWESSLTVQEKDRNLKKFDHKLQVQD